MLDNAIATLKEGEKPCLHPDGEIQYWWDSWVRRCAEVGIVRSRSKKACSPDNSAAEGFFGRLENEFLYYRDW
jgi:putative transposase